MAKRIKTIDMRPAKKKPGLLDRILDKVLPDRKPPSVPSDPKALERFRSEGEAIVAELEAQGFENEAKRFDLCLRAFPTSSTEYLGDLADAVKGILRDKGAALPTATRAHLETFHREFLAGF